MTSRTIEITAADGGTFSGYLAVPEGGSGPGLILGQEIFGINKTMRETADSFAEEGYVVLAPDLFWRLEPGIELGYGEADFQKAFGYFERFDVDQAIDDIGASITALQALDECTGGVGFMGFCLGGKLAFLTAARQDVAVAISFYGVGLPDLMGEAADISCPIVFHCAELDKFCPPEAYEAIRDGMKNVEGAEIYLYPGADHGFYNNDRDIFDKSSASMAHSRTLAALRRALGPRYDLEALWDQHCYFEFAVRDVDATMGTMVAEPYVNHIPTMTGGVGYKNLHRFYLNHFVNANPDDTKLTPVSRTVGADRVVDEMLFSFTHDREIDWLLPGVAPTGKFVEIPIVAVINFRGGKLYHEHIYWDQASVLVQVGLLDPEGLPVGGADVAKKMFDASSLESNRLMSRWADSAPDAAE
jgi:carboxymethylenebutenolidase